MGLVLGMGMGFSLDICGLTTYINHDKVGYYDGREVIAVEAKKESYTKALEEVLLKVRVLGMLTKEWYPIPVDTAGSIKLRIQEAFDKGYKEGVKR